MYRNQMNNSVNNRSRGVFVSSVETIAMVFALLFAIGVIGSIFG